MPLLRTIAPRVVRCVYERSPHSSVPGGRLEVDVVANSSFRDTVANFREYAAPLPTKLRLALSNTLIKVRTRSRCCGHPGQPGC